MKPADVQENAAPTPNRRYLWWAALDALHRAVYALEQIGLPTEAAQCKAMYERLRAEALHEEAEQAAQPASNGEGEGR